MLVYQLSCQSRHVKAMLLNALLCKSSLSLFSDMGYMWFHYD